MSSSRRPVSLTDIMQVSEDDDLGTRDEIRLGELVKEKYHVRIRVIYVVELH